MSGVQVALEHVLPVQEQHMVARIDADAAEPEADAEDAEDAEDESDDGSEDRPTA